MLCLISGILAIKYFQSRPDLQSAVILIIASFYVLWGLIYHEIKGDFHLKIMIEYLLVAIIAVLLFKGALLR